MLAQVFRPAPSSRRAFSFFSNKSGGGRSINASSHKPKVPVTKATTTKTSSTTQESKPAPAHQLIEETPAAPLPPKVELESLFPSPTSTLHNVNLIHPTPTLPTLHLHNFFALDRPMLLLNQSPSALFQSSPVQSLEKFSAPEQQLGPEETLMEDQDADIHAARLLARSMVIQKIGSVMDWADVTAKLGIPNDMVIEMDSTKRKRKKKMTKHRYKKRRKLQRAERRRLGK
ncbi:hypothetical protein FRC02_002146 [Tulasnella sp. 418]|nr:hypothetical protein FRC02_002146 [Tulasnella sp. 418]